MNDDELMTAMRESFTGVHSAAPVERIAHRSRTVRARRLGAGITTVAAAAVLGAGLGPSGVFGSTSHPAPAQLAAWTAAKQADGDITVTISRLHDPAGPQSTLNTDGVRASVSFKAS